MHAVHAPTLEQWLADWDIRGGSATDEAMELFHAAPGDVRTTQPFSTTNRWGRLDVFLPDGLRRGGEVLRAGELGHRLPAAAEPAELLQRPLPGRVGIGVVGQTDLAMRGLPAPPAESNMSPSSRRGSTAIMTSAYSPASWHESGPDTAMPMGGGSGGRSHSRADSASRWSPRKVTVSPSNSRRMIWTASDSISWRMSTGGQPWPMTCSLRFSPEPRPSVKRPSDSSWIVAAF